MVTTEAVIAEAAHHLIGYHGSADALCEIIESGGVHVEPVADMGAVCKFLRRYQTDFADACVVWLSERYPRARVFTIDFSDFRVYRRLKNQRVPIIEPPA
ncbi:MAG TPA: DNA-binding protein [Opitutaceae bacterium]|nr:DNA-binding protein [Opitutaceae bacterium]